MFLSDASDGHSYVRRLNKLPSNISTMIQGGVYVNTLKEGRIHHVTLDNTAISRSKKICFSVFHFPLFISHMAYLHIAKLIFSKRF